MHICFCSHAKQVRQCWDECEQGRDEVRQATFEDVCEPRGLFPSLLPLRRSLCHVSTTMQPDYTHVLLVLSVAVEVAQKEAERAAQSPHSELRSASASQPAPGPVLVCRPIPHLSSP